MDAEIKRLENEIKQACLIDKPRMTRQGVDDRTTRLEYCHQEFMTLLPWLRPHLTKHSNQGSALHMVEHVAPAVTREIEKFLQTILEGKLKSRTSGATT